MIIRALETRKTPLGLFRFGLVYTVDEASPAVRRHVLPLLKGDSPSFEEISRATAKKSGSPLHFTPPATSPDVTENSSNLRGAVAKARKAQKEAEGNLAALKDELLKAVGDRDAALANLEDQEDLLAAAQQEITDLKAKIADMAEASK